MDYTYIVPKNLQQQLIATLRVNGQRELSELLISATIEFKDVGLAYYAGMKGDNWDNHPFRLLEKLTVSFLSYGVLHHG